MNRLWVRLSLAFTAVVLLAMFLIGMTVRLAFETTDLSREEVPPEVREYFSQFRQDSPPFDVTAVIIIAGTVAIIAGVGMSKSLTAPLDELGEAAQAIGQQDLSRRVTVHGSSEIRVVAERFNQMAGQLETAETLRRNLLSDVAHELRHPVHILQGNLQAILDEVYPMTKKEIARLVDQTQHLSRMIHDLHELAQAEARQLPLYRQKTDMAQLIKETAASFKPAAVSKKIEIRVELLGAIPQVEVDAVRIRQVMHNLLDNALRHTPENGRVDIQVERKEADLRVSVTDSGAGIEPGDLPYIFDRFYRTDTARSREKGSAGLGLAIVRAIVQAHDGDVTAVSPGIGQGSLISFTLPIRQ